MFLRLSPSSSSVVRIVLLVGLGVFAALLAHPALLVNAARVDGSATTSGLAQSTSLVINEIDYDQPSTDAAEWIELKNIGTSAIDLNGWYLELVNGTGGGAAIYDSLTLPSHSLAAGAYYVVCFNPPNVVNCDYNPGGATTNRIQNGAPDAVGLRNPGDLLIDAVSYEGDSGAPYTETTGSGLEDSSAEQYAGVSRFPDGTDTDVNNVDLSFRCGSPGQPNVSANSNCPAPQINTATPLPSDTPTPSPTPTPDSGGETGPADLSIEKVASPDPVIAGEQLIYTVVSTNNGPASAPNVDIVDSLPANARFVSATPSGGGACTTPAVGALGGTVDCEWPGNTAAGTQRSVTIVVDTCPEEGCAEGALSNNATTSLTSDEPETGPPSKASDLFFSEYIEGSSNNKAVELYNGTGAAIDLTAGQYVLEIYSNGSSSVTTSIDLVGTVADGDVFVFAENDSDAAILAVADQVTLSNQYLWNGDDAVVLRKGGAGGTILDVIGQVGFDPGSGWGTAPNSTRDSTIVRHADICGGDTDPTDDFEPNLDALTGEWDGFDRDTFEYLGTHEADCSCGGESTDLFISEYIEGSSNNKALEFYNATGAEVDLTAGAYQVEFYFNGNTSVGSTITLDGTLADGDVYVVCDDAADAAILAVADKISTSSFFNGDDAIVLRKGGSGGPILDVIGQVGFDPGSGWGTAPFSTRDSTIVRRPDICAGDTNPSDDFEPNLDSDFGEWDGNAQNTFEFLGSHESNCCPPAPSGPTDPNPDNNAVTVETAVDTMADLSLTKSDDPDPVLAGQPLTYELVVVNSGPSNSAGTVLVDTLPSYVDFVSATIDPPGPSCSEAGNVVTCDLGTMGAPDQCEASYPTQYSITIEVTVDPRTPCSNGLCPGSPGEPLVNEAIVDSQNCLADPDPADNSVSEETEVLAGADVVIETPIVFLPNGEPATTAVGGSSDLTAVIEQALDCVGPGALLTVQQEFSNTGPNAVSPQFDNPGNEFVAVHPPQVFGRPDSCAVQEGGGTCSVTNGIAVWNGTIEVGQTVLLEYQVRVKGGVPVGIEMTFDGTVHYDEYNIGQNTSQRSAEATVATSCPSVIDPNQQLGMQVHLPILNYMGADETCTTWLEIQALGSEAMKAVLVTWGDNGFCPPQAAGPLKVECTGLLKPGTTWVMTGDQIPQGAKSGMLFKFSARKLSDYGLDDVFGFDDVFADLMCETLFFGVVGDADDFRRFKQAYNAGGEFSGIPMDLASGSAQGGFLAVEVLRSCNADKTPGAKVTSKYNGIAGSHLGEYDQVYGGYMYYVPLVYAKRNELDSWVYIQNGGLECSSVEIWLKAQNDCLRANICEIMALAPGETYAFDPNTCVGPGWLGSLWLRASQPMGVAVDIWGRDTLMTYIGEPSELNYTFDPEQAHVTPGNQVAFGPLVYSEYQGWDSGIQVQNLSAVSAAKVKVYFLDRSGDVVTTLVDWICPRGSQTYFLPVIADLPGNWVGSVRVESQEYLNAGGPAVRAPNIVAVATLMKYKDSQRTDTAEAIAYNLLPEHKVFDWQIGGLGGGGLESGVGLIAVPSLMGDLEHAGITTEIAIANVVPKPGFTDFAIYIYDQNGLLDYVCQKLNEKQVEYIDVQTWGFINTGFKGSAVISATFWEHDVFADDGFFLRNLVGLGAVTVERTGTMLGTDVAGDEAAGSRGIPFKQSDVEDEQFAFSFMGPTTPLCPGLPDTRGEQGKLVASDLFISEYVEGSANNKALEFYNGTGSPIDLGAGDYVLQVFFNGNFAPGTSVFLAGTVQPGDVWVLADDDATGAILSVADQTTSQFLFNGNDAVLLRKGGEGGQVLDRIGEVGFDPGAQWGSGLISTQNATLRKRPSVVAGDGSAFEDFEPNLDPVSGDWDGLPQDTFDGLGFHATN